ncbi:MAG: tRNA (adenosine(37)-N6)-threonylcarbamoyltransferase complex dimerization subunit type 1 TsaB [Lachnospiraceae bacterium]|nr:tRNA (adenosine(37)-N6)-threonylcarbamoyltransferase complex dimerization subunit type 1 TsaB [Lachnospiraceae bacterium]
MKILGIDSSGLVASVAVVEGEILLAEYTTDYKKTHSQTLMPMLEAIKNMIDLDMESIDAIAISAGPGSFTGLRIGSATAKGLGLALSKPIVEVPTLEGLAFNLWGTDKLICPIMDARRNQVYTGIYEFDEYEDDRQHLNIVMPQCAIDISLCIEKINNLAREVIFLGDGVDVYREKIEELISVPHYYAPASMNRQKASSVATLGELYFEKGIFVDAKDHAPEYLRQSQAEREREEGKI